MRASKKLRNDELLITNLAASRLRMELDRVPLWRGDNVATRQVIDDFARSLYLPRVQGPEILTRAMMDGVQLLTWSKDSFAYADSFDEKEGRYRGLRCGQMVTIAASEPTGFLVKPDVAAKQRGRTTSTTSARPAIQAQLPLSDARDTAGGAIRQLPKRFHGSAGRTRVGRDAGRIADEVISPDGIGRLRSGVTLEIEVRCRTGS